MKMVGVFVIWALTALPLWSQAPALSKSVLLEGVEAIGDARTVDHWRTVYGAYDKTRAATRELTITVRNMSASPGQFEIEWFFFGKPVKGGRRFLYEKGTRPLTLAPGAFESFAVESKELTSRSTRDYYYWGYNYKTGDKPDGWVLRAKVGEEVVRVKASNAQLEELEKNREEFSKFLERSDAKPR